jgi:hypothetical protein
MKIILSFIVAIIVYFLLENLYPTKLVENLKLTQAQCNCFYDEDFKYILNAFLNQITDELKKPFAVRQLTKAVCVIKLVHDRKPGWQDFLNQQAKNLAVPAHDRKGILRAYLNKEYDAALKTIQEKGWLELIPPGGPLDSFFQALDNKLSSLNYND